MKSHPGKPSDQHRAVVADILRCLRELVPSVTHRSDHDLKRMAAAARDECIAPNGPQTAAGALPFTLGRSARLGHEVELVYEMGGGCILSPEVVIAYREVDRATCCAQKQWSQQKCGFGGCFYNRCAPAWTSHEPAAVAESCASPDGH
jgi:hypothetical protein